MTGPVKKLRSEVHKSEQGTEGLNEELSETESVLKDIQAVAATAFAAFGIAELYETGQAVAFLTEQVRTLTGTTEADAEKQASAIMSIADTWGADYREVLLATNALTNEMGGTFEDNLALIEQGFRKGANSNGQFLEQLREYPAQFSDTGTSVNELIGLITQANRQGIFNDKALDSVKEAQISIREMTQASRDALAGVGVDADLMLAKINSGQLSITDAVKQVSLAMKDMNVEARQAVIADVFRGAGEDAGGRFLQQLGTMETRLENIEDRTTAAGNSYRSFKATLTEIRTEIATQLSPIFEFFNTLIGENKQLVMGITIVLGTLGLTLAVVTAAQWALNAAMTANPIGLIIVGIGALIGLMAALYTNVTPVRDAFDSVGSVFVELWDSARLVWASLTEIFALFTGGEAEMAIGFWDIVGAGIRWMLMPLRLTTKLIGMFFKGIAFGLNWIKGLFSEFSGTLGAWWDSISQRFAWFFDPLIAAFEAVKKTFLSIWKWIKKWIIDPLGEAFAWLLGYTDEEMADAAATGDPKAVQKNLSQRGNRRTQNLSPFADTGSGGTGGGSLNMNTGAITSQAQTNGGRIVNMNVEVSQTFELHEASLLRKLNEMKEQTLEFLVDASRDATIIAGT